MPLTQPSLHRHVVDFGRALREHGLFATDQLSVRVTELSLIGEAMTRLRTSPPEQLGGLRVDRVDDLALGSSGLPPTEGLRYTSPSGPA